MHGRFMQENNRKKQPVACSSYSRIQTQERCGYYQPWNCFWSRNLQPDITRGIKTGNQLTSSIICGSIQQMSSSVRSLSLFPNYLRRCFYHLVPSKWVASYLHFAPAVWVELKEKINRKFCKKKNASVLLPVIGMKVGTAAPPQRGHHPDD